ncbi:hypothetical protein [uncultured Ilyobacter sp.]|uniref:hypothetical protein n=1 Tax=uncultured Ilyobacter sp. TaxID=544433 RepID=UPI002AA69AAA|nr:hypothetical protein [uncultured Ilyobacter sp.]
MEGEKTRLLETYIDDTLPKDDYNNRREKIEAEIYNFEILAFFILEIKNLDKCS